MTTERSFMPELSDELPAGPRPMIAVVPAIPGHEEPLAAAITTLTAAVRHLTQLIELPVH